MSFALFLEVLLLGLVLSADSFSAAVAMGSRPCTRNDALKFALSSGGAEAVVALIGFLAGSHILKYIAAFDHWIAFGLLAAVAIHMVIEAVQGLRSKEMADECLQFHGFGKVLIVSLATSLDAFGVGISLGVTEKPIIPFIISIGIFAFGGTLLGLYLARKLSRKFGPLFTFVAALILAFMAVEMLKI